MPFDKVKAARAAAHYDASGQDLPGGKHQARVQSNYPEARCEQHGDKYRVYLTPLATAHVSAEPAERGAWYRAYLWLTSRK